MYAFDKTFFYQCTFFFLYELQMTKKISDDEFMNEIARRLRAARKAAGFEHIPDAVERFGWSFHSYSSHEGGRRRPSREMAVRYAKAFKSDPSYLRGEDLYDSTEKVAPIRPPSNASFPPQFHSFINAARIPLYGQTEAGPNGKFVMNGMRITDVFCPPGLENVASAYAVRVFGTSMEPRFKAGETVWLNPELPVRAGDDVVVQLKPEADGDELASYIKEFRSKSAKVVRLWQHNPDEGESHELVFDADDVFSIHKVVHHAMT